MKPYKPIDCFLTVKVEGDANVGLLRLEDARDVSYPHRDKASLAHPCAFNSLEAWRNLIRRQAEFIEYNLELYQLNVNITDRDGKIDRKEIRGRTADFSLEQLRELLNREGIVKAEFVCRPVYNANARYEELPAYNDSLRNFAHISPGGDVLTNEEVIVDRAMYPPAEVLPIEGLFEWQHWACEEAADGIPKSPSTGTSSGDAAWDKIAKLHEDKLRPIDIDVGENKQKKSNTYRPDLMIGAAIVGGDCVGPRVNLCLQLLAHGGSWEASQHRVDTCRCTFMPNVRGLKFLASQVTAIVHCYTGLAATTHSAQNSR
ncbi:hypothetical protein LTS10_006811 [Elasticomyces elasticus]|nr:hypothetical protein LTS10_006811 [Elasticomyces elasticus]